MIHRKQRGQIALPLGLFEAGRQGVWACALVALVLFASGCASAARGVRLRSGPKETLAERFNSLGSHDSEPSDRTAQVLRRYDLTELFKTNPREALKRLEVEVHAQPTSEKIHAFAELSYRTGRHLEEKEPQAALDLYGASLMQSYAYLFDPRLGSVRNPYDPQYRGACDLYNSSLERALRLVQQHGELLPGKQYTLDVPRRKLDIQIVVRGDHWDADTFDKFEFVSDYEVQGLTNMYRTFGLGVPLIGIRTSVPKDDPAAVFYPPKSSAAVTAFLRFTPDETSRVGRCKAMLELYDPLEATDIDVAAVRVPLESDLSTPVAYFLDVPALVKLADTGLFNVAEGRKLQGLYLTEPYHSDKMPLIFVHGLWSDPTTWAGMYNDLRSSPQLRSQYQFWFYFYPSGQPFWTSAGQFRNDLAKMRKTLDPLGRNASLDEIVLVGHSMGGLISKLQTIDSGDRFWKLVSDEPFDKVKASPRELAFLRSTFFFSPNPSIKRVVTIGTPHRGSQYSNDLTRYFGRKLIEMPRRMVAWNQKLLRENPQLKKSSMLTISTSIDSLAPGNPFLETMLEAPEAPWVTYHNIVGVLQEQSAFSVQILKNSDGVVKYASAHLDDVASEKVVNASHTMIHAHPVSVLEVQRILGEHLIAAGRAPNTSHTRMVGNPRDYFPRAQPAGHSAPAPISSDVTASPGTSPHGIPATSGSAGVMPAAWDDDFMTGQDGFDSDGLQPIIEGDSVPLQEPAVEIDAPAEPPVPKLRLR